MKHLNLSPNDEKEIMDTLEVINNMRMRAGCSKISDYTIITIALEEYANYVSELYGGAE